MRPVPNSAPALGARCSGAPEGGASALPGRAGRAGPVAAAAPPRCVPACVRAGAGVGVWAGRRVCVVACASAGQPPRYQLIHNADRLDHTTVGSPPTRVHVGRLGWPAARPPHLRYLTHDYITTIIRPTEKNNPPGCMSGALASRTSSAQTVSAVMTLRLVGLRACTRVRQ